jgi:competence CoiA-like predicted nuclease
MGKKTIRATTCMLDGQEISIDEALTLRGQTGRSSPNFRCKECAERVSAHKAGGSSIAHFEHLSRNSDCSLSVAHYSRS